MSREANMEIIRYAIGELRTPDENFYVLRRIRRGLFVCVHREGGIEGCYLPPILVESANYTFVHYKELRTLHIWRDDGNNPEN